MDEPLLPQVFWIATRQSAKGHLETAITLWFEEKDDSAIHTLAVAAQGALNQMCKDKGIKPSQIHALIQKKSPNVKKKMRSAQNLFKHGRHEVREWKKVAPLIPEYTELVLSDCVSMFTRLFGTLSPLMRLFAFRYNLFNPEAFPMQMTIKGVKIEYLRGLTRSEFIEEVLPRLRVEIGKPSP
jgi:hypothetical protein